MEITLVHNAFWRATNSFRLVYITTHIGERQILRVTVHYS